MAEDRLGGLNFEDLVLRRQQHINTVKDLDIKKFQVEAQLDGLISQIERHKGALQELDMLMHKVTQAPEQVVPATDPNAESDM